jgi:hypothetical protein
MISKREFKQIMMALFHGSSPTIVNGTNNAFHIDLAKVQDVLIAFCDDGTEKFILDADKKTMSFLSDLEPKINGIVGNV